MLSIVRKLQGDLRREQGQVLVVGVILIGVLAGGAAIAVDTGSYMSHRRSLQNDADAIALAASQGLPSESEATALANSWAAKNGIDTDNMTLTITPQDLPNEPNPKVEVELTADHSLTFLRLLGSENADVNADAVAIKTSPAGGDGVSPLSVEEEVLEGIGLGDEVVLKYDANNITQGNTSPIRIDGSGSGNCSTSDNYCTGLMLGAETVVCAEGTDETYCSGPSVVDTEPGNKVGGTREAITWRINETDVECSEFEGANGVFEDDPLSNEDGVYRINPECNPFINNVYESHRVMIIPVIDELPNGSAPVTIVSFALFYLERVGDGGCTGNECEVVGRFVTVNENVGLLAGTFNEQAFNTFVRLVAN